MGDVGADPLDFALLERSQQQRLDSFRELADLVQEQRAVVRHLEFAGAVGVGTSEGASHVAEQLALRDRLRQRRAVDVDQGGVAAAGRLVDRLDDELFAGTGLAGDEHGHVARGEQADLLAESLHGRAAAQELAAALAGLAHQVGGHVPRARGLALEGFDQVASPHRRRGQGAERSQESRVDRVEGTRLLGVGRQDADQLTFEPEGAAEAGVDTVVRQQVICQQAVERIGKVAVGGEDRGSFGVGDDLEPRVLTKGEPLRAARVAEPVAGEHDQVIAAAAEQDGGVAGERVAHGPHQAAVTFLRRKGPREVERHLEQQLEQLRGQVSWCCLSHNGCDRNNDPCVAVYTT